MNYLRSHQIKEGTKQMFLITYSILLSILTVQVAAKLKLGTNILTINSNSLLELDNTTKEMLIPRLALSATNLTTPLCKHIKGMVVYNTATVGKAPNNVMPGYYYNDGAAWKRMATSSEINDLYLNNGALVSNRIVAQGSNTRNFIRTATTGTVLFTVDGSTFNDGLGIGTNAQQQIDELLKQKK